MVLGTVLLGGMAGCGQSHSQGEALYIARVSNIHGAVGSSLVHPWIMDHMDAMVAEGERACRWINSRPSPHDEGQERTNYVASTSPMVGLPKELSEFQGLFDETAWHSLCQPTFIPQPED
jgi:hypothetical protein